MAKAGLLFVGTGDGLFLFSNPNEIGRWLKIGQPFRGHAVAAVWALPHDPLVVFAAVVGMGVHCARAGQTLLPLPGDAVGFLQDAWGASRYRGGHCNSLEDFSCNLATPSCTCLT